MGTAMTNFRGEDMKVSRAKDSQGPDKQSAQEQSSEQQAQQATQQTTGQQSGQESGQPAEQNEEQESNEQSTSDEEEEDDSDDSDDSEPVPDGTTAEILRWVGDDQQRAQRALDKEQADDRPRAGLTGELKKILG